MKALLKKKNNNKKEYTVSTYSGVMVSIFLIYCPGRYGHSAGSLVKNYGHSQMINVSKLLDQVTLKLIISWETKLLDQCFLPQGYACVGES